MYSHLQIAHAGRQVTQATQGNKTNLADVFRYMVWLAGRVKEFATLAQSDPDIDTGFGRHTIHAFNGRWKEMASDESRLALFLHPRFRVHGKAADPEKRNSNGTPALTIKAGFELVKNKVSCA